MLNIHLSPCDASSRELSPENHPSFNSALATILYINNFPAFGVIYGLSHYEVSLFSSFFTWKKKPKIKVFGHTNMKSEHSNESD